MLERENLIDRLLALPAEIAAAELTLLKFDEERRIAARGLEESSDRLLIDGAIDGKNAEVRSAQLRQATMGEQSALDMAERLVASARVQLHRLQAEHGSLRAIARVLAATDN
jgi:hypothetical protein